MRAIEDEARRQTRAWLLKVKDNTGWSWTRIAKAAGIATTTLTKAVNDPDHPHVTSTTTIAKISAATGVPPPEHLAEAIRAAGAGGFAEPEAVPYDPADQPPDLDRLVTAFIAGRTNLVAWELKTRALELAGYIPGDVVVLDMNATAKTKDIVCAQVYDFDAGKARTIWRRYEQPYLVAASTDPAVARPERDDKAAIKGVVLMSFRPRAAA